jgi:electron transport complex protein RnfC
MTRLRSFPRGGVRLPSHKEYTRAEPISNAALPPLAVIPMRQHAGEPAECMVKPGDLVKEGMLIGRARGESSANVHASIPGRVVEVGEVIVSTGEKSAAAFIELEGEFHTSIREHRPATWEGMSPAELVQRIRAAGVVGLGGSLAPTHAKLAAARRKGVAVLVANGVECEPYLSADHRLMREKPSEIVEGMRIIQQIVATKRSVLALSEDTRDVAPLFEGIFVYLGPHYTVETFARKFPQGEESMIFRALSSPDSLVLNVATIFAVWEAVVLEKPLIERIVTVAGPLIRHPRNLKVRLGTPAGDLFDECGDLPPGGSSIVLGGPMTGRTQFSLDVPVTKAVGGVLAFPLHGSVLSGLPCIRCGRCIDACPSALNPSRLYTLVKREDSRSAMRDGLSRCIVCGCCAYVCPSRIPLADVLRRGKLLAARA